MIPFFLDLIPVTMEQQSHWCTITYYEMSQRVGELFCASRDIQSVTIDGYTDPSSADRFCLGCLSNVKRSRETELTRHYIGRGIKLTYTNGAVFLECLSDNVIFVQSANCNEAFGYDRATVLKVVPECSLKIFDEHQFASTVRETVNEGYEAIQMLSRICNIRISFVKGWGEEYR
jgi:hypothetical protein